MRDTQPVKGQRRVLHEKRRTRPAPKAAPARASGPTHEAADEARTASGGYGERLMFKTPSVSRRIMRELSRGKYRIDAALDLHGLKSDEARREIVTFIQECIRERMRCVRIVHGKGHGSGARGPVLKAVTDAELRGIDAVLAFCSAQERDGGTGAVYVLLKV